MDTPLDVNLNMVDLNGKAVMALCQLTVPYMPSGSQIINIASVAAFQPIPYINVYGATKALVLHYSRALNRELKKNGIRVMAVCPGKDMSKCGFKARLQALGVKILPHSVVMDTWLPQQELDE